MNVLLSKAIFADEDRELLPLGLVSLFEACHSKDHAILFEQGVEESNCYRSWRDGLPESIGEVVDAVLRYSIQCDAREIVDCTVVATSLASDLSRSPPHVALVDLPDLLRAPIAILVENEVNDAAFLKSMGFGFEGDSFVRSVDAGRIRFEHAGGSSMESIVRSRASDKMRIHRMWVVFDSDALVPNCPSAEAESKAVACRAAGARFHMLLRRAIENYLPPEIIDNSLPRSSGPSAARKAAGALRRLSPEQRAHYNLKGGFNADLARVSPGGKDAAMRDRIQALYAQLGADGDRDALSGGFGRDIAELFVPNPAAGRPRISEATRRSDGQEPEMHALIRSIVRSL